MKLWEVPSSSSNVDKKKHLPIKKIENRKEIPPIKKINKLKEIQILEYGFSLVLSVD